MEKPPVAEELVVKLLSENHKEVIERLNKIEITQAVQNTQLSEHMRRTEAAEKSLEVLSNKTDSHHSEILILRSIDTDRKRAMERWWKLAITVGAALLLKLFL